MAKGVKTTRKPGGKTSGRARAAEPAIDAVDAVDAPEAPAAGGKRGKSAAGKHLVIVESPTKAKTINKYLGSDYIVMASVGHVRDLPARSPKGTKREDNPVPGVDLKNNFAPTYEVMAEKKKTVTDLRRAAKSAADIWFATDLDREGEAIAWHLAQALDVPVSESKRVVFNAITKAEIQNAFSKPRPIDENRVNAQQARRILDRIVGYQVSPLLWKKVAGGLSAGRVQSVATRLVVEREQEIDAFLPEEYWKISGIFATDLAKADGLAKAWREFLVALPAKVEVSNSRFDGPSLKDRLIWLSQRACLRGELMEVDGKPFEAEHREQAIAVAKALGYVVEKEEETQDPKGRGPAKFLVVFRGAVGRRPEAKVRSIQVRRTSRRAPAPFITSTLQQTASTRMGFGLQRTMRIAQQLYEGIDLKTLGGPTGLITYMRTDSTHLSAEALTMARGYITKTFGDKYLPEKPNFFTSSNKAAQEAHEAIRPTDADLTPDRVHKYLSEEQNKIYRLIWERFIACQMVNAEVDSTTVLIEVKGSAPVGHAVFKSTGSMIAFDGFYRVSGTPGGDEAILPKLQENQPLAALDVDPTQHFTSPPPRYTEASLQKKLEEEGIGRPSTYAAIIQTIQDRKYVSPMSRNDRRLYATDLGRVVTAKLCEAFPQIMDVAYTRAMELELDKIEEEHHDWVTMLKDFYGPFKKNLDDAHESMVHAKAEMEPAPFKCGKCGAPTVYRFGRNGRFLSCGRYPDCDYAAPIDREGNPQEPELSDIACPLCGDGMTRRVGRFGPFLGCKNYPKCKGIVKLDAKKGIVVSPKPPPLVTDLVCTKCGSPMNLRRSARGPWLSCSAFPKCRGRMGWTSIDEKKQADLETALAAHEAAHPQPVIKTVEGRPVGDDYVPRIVSADGDAAASPAAVTPESEEAADDATV
ncbi:MAG: topoisomerase DNA-binding C4 zinc finger domain-containing protein [Planctomycetes bacterium]|nr:topoisomerase DNA-binding C4 zinc finger domain-containing protein [Planctomycetota bacterium]